MLYQNFTKYYVCTWHDNPQFLSHFIPLQPYIAAAVFDWRMTMKISFITCFQSKNIKLEKDDSAGVLQRRFDDLVIDS